MARVRVSRWTGSYNDRRGVSVSMSPKEALAAAAVVGAIDLIGASFGKEDETIELGVWECLNCGKPIRLEDGGLLWRDARSSRLCAGAAGGQHAPKPGSQSVSVAKAYTIEDERKARRIALVGFAMYAAGVLAVAAWSLWGAQ